MTIQFPRVRNRADIPQVLNALAGPFVLMAPLALGLRGPELLGAWLAVWLYICRHNYILHNHVHHPFTDSKRFNRYLDWSLGFVTAMTAGNWRIMHVHGAPRWVATHASACIPSTGR
jgi:fatty acid desaturase